jgi:exoribonuclease R
LYERDFIFDVLLQAAIKRFARHSPDRQSARLELALESLAIQISQARQSLIHKRLDIKMILFLQSYCKLLIGVSLGRRGTSYPLSILWRWRHKNYKDL